MIKGLIVLLICQIALAKDFNVRTASELINALKSARAGDDIILADGNYNGKFEATQSGTSSSPITVRGSRNAVISNSGNYGFYLTGDYWVLQGFTVANSKKGIMLDSANFNLLDNLLVQNIEEEAVHFRKSSSDNTIRHSTIRNTGRKAAGYGEGVYIGSAVSNWDNDKPDYSNRNKVLNNYFGPGITAEAIDVKEGTSGGLIDGNEFNGSGMSGDNYSDSWIDVKGTKYVISNNKGTSSLNDGFQVTFFF
jgi:hypothetical protein